MKKNRSNYILFVVFVIAFLIRMFFYLVLVNKHNYNGLTMGYLNEAFDIVKGREWFMGSLNGNYQLLTLHPKGFATMMALIVWFFPNDYMLVLHILISLAEAFVCIFLFDISKNLFNNKKIGLISSFIYAVYPIAIFNSIQDLPDAFAPFLITLLVFVYFKKWKNMRTKYLLVGFVCGLSYYFRAEFFLAIFVVVIADVIAFGINKKIFSNSLLMIFVFILINSPWVIYAYSKTGKLMLSSQNAYGSAYEAIGEKKDNSQGIILGDWYVEELAVKNGYDGAWTYDANKFFKEKFVDYVKNNPKEYFGIILNYRLPKAFVPESYVWFNLNRSYDEMDTKKICEKEKLIDYNLCVISFEYAKKVEFGARYLTFPFFVSAVIFSFYSLFFKKLRKYSLIIGVYLYSPFVVSLLKQIEPRNVLGNFPIAVLLFSYVIYYALYFCCKKIVYQIGRRNR